MATLRYTIGTNRILLRNGRTLRRAARTAREPADVVDAAIGLAAGDAPGRPHQIRSEILAFLSLLKKEEPRRVLEIGTGSGGTLFLLAWAAARDARVLSLDIHRPSLGTRLLYRSFGGRRRHVAMWATDSHAVETRAAVERFFDDRPLDVLFIDGDHTYDGVRKDYELYAPLVRPGGLVAFHDIVAGPERYVGGVPRFWPEVRSSLAEPLELVESWSQGGFGIGVGRRPGPDAQPPA